LYTEANPTAENMDKSVAGQSFKKKSEFMGKKKTIGGKKQSNWLMKKKIPGITLIRLNNKILLKSLHSFLANQQRLSNKLIYILLIKTGQKLSLITLIKNKSHILKKIIRDLQH
jgi:hypothetical protein